MFPSINSGNLTAPVLCMESSQDLAHSHYFSSHMGKEQCCWTRALLNLLHKGLPLRNVAQAAAENPSWDMSFTGQDIHCSIYGLTVLVEMCFTSASDELDEGNQGRSSSEGFLLYLICFLNHWNEDVCLAQRWVNILAFPCMSFFHW